MKLFNNNCNYKKSKSSFKFLLLLAALFVLLQVVNGSSSSGNEEQQVLKADNGKLVFNDNLDMLLSADSATESADKGTKKKNAGAGQKFEFQAEVNRMMKLLIHSLYKAKEIFLRELISNASDALDKIRFLSLTDKSQLGDVTDLKITIRVDPEKKLIIITDTGLGMTKEHLIKNLGTIAKSGTAEFLQALESKSEDSHLIGQFGVGFYSAFLVADKVTVVSKNNDDPKQHVWESHAEGDFTVFEDPRGNTLGRGTQIILHVKEDAEEFLNEITLEEIIRKYSEFINFPIYLLVNKSEEVEVEEEDEKVIADSAEDKKTEETKPESETKEDGEATVEDVSSTTTADDDEQAEKKKEKKKVKREYQEWELMNGLKPIWTRDSKNVSEKEYFEFYKSFGKDDAEPLSYLHFKAEGDVEFRSIIYIPSKAKQNLLQSVDAHVKAIKLFVKRVFITDELLDFLPKWLGFLKGLVDSDDLPLNVSRETLQQHKLLSLMKRKVVRKAIELIKSIADTDEEKYEKFLKEFGTFLKLGVIEDVKNRKKLMKLLRFHSSKTQDGESSKRISLETYVERMKKGQEQIYFLTGPSLDEIRQSPFVETLVARGYEVLYLDEPIDEYLIQSVYDYNRKPFQNVAKEGLKTGKDDAEDEKELTEKFKPLGDYLKTVLGKYVEKVVVSHRLTTSPCAIVAGQYGWSGNMERMMNSQALQAGEDPMKVFASMQKKTLEINPRHPVIMKMLSQVDANQIDKQLDELALVLYEVTAIRSGYMLKDTPEFANRIERVIRQNLGVSLDETVNLDYIKPAEDKSPDDKDDDLPPMLPATPEESATDDDDQQAVHDEL